MPSFSGSSSAVQVQAERTAEGTAERSVAAPGNTAVAVFAVPESAAEADSMDFAVALISPSQVADSHGISFFTIPLLCEVKRDFMLSKVAFTWR